MIKAKSMQPTVGVDSAGQFKVKASITTQHIPVKSTPEQTTEELLPVAKPSQTSGSCPDTVFSQLSTGGAPSPPPAPAPTPAPPLTGGVVPSPAPPPPIPDAPAPTPAPPPPFGAPVPPPPPPPPGGVPIPPPPPPFPSGVPPPPPPGPPGLQVIPHLPYGMKPKKKYEVKSQTKRIYWKTVIFCLVLSDFKI